MTPATLNPNALPRHVAIIMDGNGRWAKREGVARAAGHEAGAKAVRKAVEACRELEKIDVLSLYAFSTENWMRSRAEVNALFRLLSKYIHLEAENLHKEDIRIKFMGRRDGLTRKTLDDIAFCEDLTADNRSMVLNVALNYGGRAEIADAARAIAEEVLAGALKPARIDEACVAKHLYDPSLPDIDLLIRTSGELRLSNFMLWQMSYGEIVVTKTLWPDFRKRHLHDALIKYQSRQRRFGARK